MHIQLQMTFLLTAWIDNCVPFKQHLASLVDSEQEIELKNAVRQGLAMDVAISNVDVCGAEYTNLVVVPSSKSGSETKVYRVDVGGSMFFLPTGARSFSKGKLFEATSESVAATVKTMTTETPMNKALVSCYSSVLTVGSSVSSRPKTGALSAIQANHMLFSGFPLNPSTLAQHASKIRDSGFKASMLAYQSKSHLGGADWIAAISTVDSRLQILAQAMIRVPPLDPLESLEAAFAKEAAKVVAREVNNRERECVTESRGR